MAKNADQFDPLHGIPEGSDIDISKYEWPGLPREGYQNPQATLAKVMQYLVNVERERCARIAEAYGKDGSPDEVEAARAIAAQIREGL